jgi:hypothetical protein
LQRVELTSHAIRLARQLHQRFPEDGEVAGLLALMLLTDARRPARTRPDGTLVPLAEQDRSRWDTRAIAEGVALITGALASAPVGPYQLQAAIAAVHDEAAHFEDTDWDQILGLYELLGRLIPGPMVELNRVGRRGHGPRPRGRPPPPGGRPRPSARARRRPSGGTCRLPPGRRCILSLPEQRYLRSRAARLRPQPAHDPSPAARHRKSVLRLGIMTVW